MTQLHLFSQKPILEVLKPFVFKKKYSRQHRRNLRKMKKVKNFFIKGLDFINQIHYNMLVQKTKECKMNRILENEIQKLISRTPTEEELNSAIEYIDSCADDLTKAEHIPELLQGWLHDCMTKCDWCGAWGLISEMEEENGYYYCDGTCLQEANGGWDMHAEAKAEYVALNR